MDAVGEALQQWTPSAVAEAIKSLSNGDMAILWFLLGGTVAYFLIRAWRCNK